MIIQDNYGSRRTIAFVGVIIFAIASPILYYFDDLISFYVSLVFSCFFLVLFLILKYMQIKSKDKFQQQESFSHEEMRGGKYGRR